MRSRTPHKEKSLKSNPDHHRTEKVQARDAHTIDSKLQSRSDGQFNYIKAIDVYELIVVVGPAGTGKTYIAVQKAVAALLARRVKRIILARPIVESGENLGFLPGTLEDKVHPYFRPLYDALYAAIGPESTKRMLESGVIEVAPLAYMRGRAQPLTANILTPSGYRLMGDLQVGDLICAPDNTIVSLTGVFPQGTKDVYEVAFSDGSKTRCSEDHLWDVQTVDTRNRSGNFQTLSIKEMMNSLYTSNGVKRYNIPISDPIDFVKQSVPIDPYLLGLLLGDGSLHENASITITSSDDEIIENVKSRLPDGYTLVRADELSYRLIGDSHRNQIKQSLAELGLLGLKSPEKFIPELYLKNNIETRLELLRGLMDSDGWIGYHKSGKNRVQFYTTSERLANDTRSLVQSLGGVVHTHKREYDISDSHEYLGKTIVHNHAMFVLDIKIGLNIFKLSRKSDRWVGTTQPLRCIKSVKRIGAEECQCISVDHVKSLYITDEYIVTHNTFDDSFIILDEAQNATKEQIKMLLTRIGNQSKLIICGDHTQIDIPHHQCGLFEAMDVVRGLEGTTIVRLTGSDVVRSELVKRIVESYQNLRYMQEEQEDRLMDRVGFAQRAISDADEQPGHSITY